MFEWFSVQKSKSLGLELAKLVKEHDLHDTQRNESKRLSS